MLWKRALYNEMSRKMLWNSCVFPENSGPKKKQRILMVFFEISMCDVVDICHAVVIALHFVSTLRLVVDLIFPFMLHV